MRVSGVSRRAHTAAVLIRLIVSPAPMPGLSACRVRTTAATRLQPTPVNHHQSQRRRAREAAGVHAEDGCAPVSSLHSSDRLMTGSVAADAMGGIL